MKKWLAWALVLCLLLPYPVPARAADGDSSDGESSQTETGETGGEDSGDTGDDSGETGGGSGGSGEEGPAEPGEFVASGCSGIEKLRPLAIRRLLDETTTDMPNNPDNVYEATPSYTAPFSAGRVRATLLQRATDRLNALRAIAGVPAVTLDNELCEAAQYGAALLGTAGVDYGYEHEPENMPAGMEESFYERAVLALNASSLNAGRTLLETPLDLMDDSDADNLPWAAHRRLQLYPALGRVGFGYVTDAPNYYDSYTVECINDASGSFGSFHYISWPASGYFPSELFPRNTAWTVTLNPGEYAAPKQDDISVTIIRESDGREWFLRGNRDYTAAASGQYLHVDNSGYGVSNCIIFRPDGIVNYEGVYTVVISGLKNRGGKDVKLSWQVDFFTMATQSQGITEVTSSRFSTTSRNVTVRAYVDEDASYLMVVAAYDRDGDILSVDARNVNLTRDERSYSFMLEKCVNAYRIKAFLLSARGHRPLSGVVQIAVTD